MKFFFLIITLIYSFNINATCKFKNTTSNDEVKYTIQESINVDDIEGHVIRISKQKQTIKNQKKIAKALG